MRKLGPLLIILFIAGVGVSLALTDDSSVFNIFLFTQSLDREVIKAEQIVDKRREELLNDLQPSVNQLILDGQTYDQNTNLRDQFASFNELNEALKVYVDRVVPIINKIIKTADFETIESSIDTLSEEDQLLAVEMLFYQKERLNYLLALNTLLEELAEQLENFEELFYTTVPPSKPILYLESVTYLFEEIEKIHSQFVTSTEAYHIAKTNYYLILSNMSVNDYFFGR